MTLGIGIHDGIPAELYHADVLCERPSLSNSIIKILLGQSPAHARDKHPRLTTCPNYEWPQTDAMKVGAVAHAMLLGAGDTYVVFNPADYRTKDGKPCVTLGCADAQQAIATARAAGHIDINQTRYDEATAIVERMRAAILADYPRWDSGKSEVTLLFDYRLNDGATISCRARLDRLVPECVCVESAEPHSHVFDPKFSGKQFSDEYIDKIISLDGWDTQNAFYTVGMEKVSPTGATPLFTFITGETYPPYQTRFVTIPDYWREEARQDVDKAANLWGACLSGGVWPMRSSRYQATRPDWISARRYTDDIATEEEVV